MRRTLVALVGGDGAGKSTVAANLVARLRALEYPTRTLDRWDIVGNADYPTARFLRHDVKDMRTCVADMPSTARFLCLLWAMSLAVSGDHASRPDGEIVVVDGYWMKHAAKEVVYGLSLDCALAVGAMLPKADLVLYLRLGPEQAWLRKQHDVIPYECGMDAACSHQSFLSHQGRIHQLLDAWSARFGWHTIDASQGVSEVVATAVDRVRLLTWASSSRRG